MSWFTRAAFAIMVALAVVPIVAADSPTARTSLAGTAPRSSAS